MTYHVKPTGARPKYTHNLQFYEDEENLLTEAMKLSKLGVKPTVVEALKTFIKVKGK